jgi:hypothetical protein
MMRSLFLGSLVALSVIGCIAAPSLGTARAARTPDPGATFQLTTLTPTAYVPGASGTVTSSGVVGKRLTITVHLRNMPAPQTIGGLVYKVWLIAPDAAVAMPGAVLAYHTDLTVDGTFSSVYHDFTAIAVTAEKDPYGLNPQNATALAGNVDLNQLQEALNTVSAPQLQLVAQSAQPAAYFSKQSSRSASVDATGQVVLPRGARHLVVRDSAATATSLILLMPLSDPYGSLWISARAAGRFTINASGPLPAAVTLQYAIVNH